MRSTIMVRVVLHNLSDEQSSCLQAAPRFFCRDRQGGKRTACSFFFFLGPSRQRLTGVLLRKIYSSILRTYESPRHTAYSIYTKAVEQCSTCRGKS